MLNSLQHQPNLATVTQWQELGRSVALFGVSENMADGSDFAPQALMLIHIQYEFHAFT